IPATASERPPRNGPTTRYFMPLNIGSPAGAALASFFPASPEGWAASVERSCGRASGRGGCASAAHSNHTDIGIIANLILKYRCYRVARYFGAMRALRSCGGSILNTSAVTAKPHTTLRTAPAVTAKTGNSFARALSAAKDLNGARTFGTNTPDVAQRQDFAVQRRNSGGSIPIEAATTGSTTTTPPATTMTRDQAKLILATGQGGDLTVAYQVYYGSQQNAPQPADIAANLLKQNAAPIPYGSVQQPSNSSSVFTTGTYIENLNLNGIESQVNQVNSYRYSNYQTAVENWAENGMRGPAPASPQYESVDVNGFQQWWNQYTASIGQGSGPPAANFVSNVTPTAT